MKDKNKDNLISSLSGITTGFLAGLIGVISSYADCRN